MMLLFLIILVGGAFVIAAIASQSKPFRQDRSKTDDNETPRAD
jgi:hypothetical protein